MFDFKKEYKEFYMPKNKPEIVNIPKANYIAVRGKGDPNEEGGAYQQAISILYAVAYTLKMSYKTDHKIKGFYEYVVPPLEGFWWQDKITLISLPLTGFPSSGCLNLSQKRILTGQLTRQAGKRKWIAHLQNF